MVSPTLQEIANHVSVAGFVGSAIALAASTTFWQNPIVASLSTLSGTASAYAMLGIQRSDDRDRLKQQLDITTARLNETDRTAQTLEHDKALMQSRLNGLKDEVLGLQVRLREQTLLLTATTAERDALVQVQSEYAALKIRYQQLDYEQTQDNLDLEALRLEHNHILQQLQQFKSEVVKHKTDAEALNVEANALRLENIQYKAQFNNIDETAKLRAESELRRIEDKLRELNAEYNRVAALYTSAVADLKKLNADYVSEFTELSEAVSKGLPEAFNAVLTERDRLLLELSGKLTQLEAPQLFDEIGEYVRANRLIRALWDSEERICLDASEIVPYGDSTGFDVYFNLRDRKSRGQSFIEALNDRGNELSIVCGTIKDLKFEYDRVNPHRIRTALVFRKPAKTDSKATIDKLWIPADQFAAKLPKLLKKPMTRIMGSTGEGKGVFANLLLAVEANQLTPALTRLHDPMDDSAEDYWQIVKASKGIAQSNKAIKTFAAEFDRRVEESIAEPRTLDIFDEVDILADRDSSINKLLLNCAKGMRHNGMRAMMIGQSPSVGKKGLEWADLDNFNCVYFGSAIYTAIDKTPALESKSEALRKEYEKLKDYCDRQNEELGLEGWNEYRTGLIVTCGKAYFFELPNADSIVCDWNNLTGQPSKEAKTLEPAKSSFNCLQCNSSNTKDRSGRKKLANGLTRYYRVCHDCQHKFEVDLSS